ncbi:hypothetical protein [Methylocaldum szegediense]|uniref:hypothetical protein n=1 Tax=Methylocaldum szegediense TaxID=73780 RepID=UPI00047D5042|nr:hypothetical protein [Methylocaldum szegediense]
MANKKQELNQELNQDELARLIDALEASISAGASTPAQEQAVDLVLDQVDDININSLPVALQASIERIKAWRQANQQAGGKASAGATREKVLSAFVSAKSAQELLLQHAVTPRMKEYLANPSNAKSLLRMRQVADAVIGNGKLPMPAIHAFNGMKRASQSLTSETIASITGNSGSLSAIRNALRAFVWLGLARASHNVDGNLVTSFRGTSFELTDEGKEILGKLV